MPVVLPLEAVPVDLHVARPPDVPDGHPHVRDVGPRVPVERAEVVDPHRLAVGRAQAALAEAAADPDVLDDGLRDPRDRLGRLGDG